MRLHVGKIGEIFDGSVELLHTGTAFGVVHPCHPKFAEQFDRLLKETGQALIVAPRLAFNTKVTPITTLTDLEIGQGMRAGEMVQIPQFNRTQEASDGIVVSINGYTRLKTAVAIMNADSGVIEILAPNGELAVLHGGFNNVDNPDGSSIVGNAIAYFKSLGFEASELKFRVGEAARACCYGFKSDDARAYAKNEERANRLKSTFGDDVTRVIEKLPRRGGIGFDVPLIAARQAEKLGVADVDVEALCTSCHGLADDNAAKADTYGTWFSNVRENPATTKANGYGARNAVVVYPV